MSRRRPTTSQLLAGAVPFLLILLVLPIAPKIVTSVRNHFVNVTTTSTRASTTTSTRAPTHSVTTTTRRFVTTTTKSATSPTKTGSKKRLSATANDPFGVGSDTSGVLQPPYTYADESLAPGTNWTLSATGILSWTLWCSGAKIDDSPQPIRVPANGNNCYVDLRDNQNVRIEWQLASTQ